jgi:hypothetical protein
MAIVFERLMDEGIPGLAVLFRAKIPGGWLVLLRTDEAESVTFVPDPRHEWDGSSIP